MTSQPFFIPSVIMLGMAIPLALGLVPPNRLCGVRTRATLSDERLWYRANRVGGVSLIMSSAVYLTVAALLPHAGNDFPTWLIHLFAFLLPLLATVLQVRAACRPPAGR